MHYGGHMRENFQRWIDDGFPAVALVERNYEEQLIPAEELLREMVGCSDILPRSTVDEISDELHLERDDWQHTYGDAARLLTARKVIA